jgi:uncharacterized membrane protein
MSTHDTKAKLQRWYVPTVAILIGVAYFVAGFVGDDLRFGVFGLALMVAVAVAMLLAGRKSETVKGLLDRQDERIRGIDNDASMFAGSVLIIAVIVGFVVEIARGQDGSPYAVLGAIAGLAYVGALIVLRLRR